MERKKNAFSYMVTLLLEWYKEKNHKDSIQECYSAFSKLSLLKLLFLASAIKTNDKEENCDLLDIFSNFKALPYGPVESDIYNAIIENKIPIFTIGDRAIWENKIEQNPIDQDLKDRIESSIKALKAKNSDLINTEAFQLVDITHKWKSWSEAYSFAEFIGQKSIDMSPSEIRNDPHKYFGIDNLK